MGIIHLILHAFYISRLSPSLPSFLSFFHPIQKPSALVMFTLMCDVGGGKDFRKDTYKNGKCYDS